MYQNVYSEKKKLVNVPSNSEYGSLIEISSQSLIGSNDSISIFSLLKKELNLNL